TGNGNSVRFSVLVRLAYKLRSHRVLREKYAGGNMRKLILAAASIAALTLVGPAAAQSPIVIKFSHVVATNTPKGLAAEKFKELAEKYTAGKVKVEVYPNSQLYKDKEELEALQLGAVKVLEAQFRSLGSIPQVMAFSEVYQALQTGVVDGQENTWSNIYTQKMHEVQKYITNTNHGYIGYVVVTNKKFWDGLPADVRAACETAMKEATEYGNGQSAKENEDALAEIKKTGKSEIIALTPEQDSAMRKAMEPDYKDVAGRVGQPLIDEFLKETRGATN